MILIFFNNAYYFQTMAQQQTNESAMFDRLKELAEKKLSNSWLTPDQIEKIIDDFIGICMQRLISNMKDVLRNGNGLCAFENERINSLEKDLSILILSEQIATCLSK